MLLLGGRNNCSPSSFDLLDMLWASILRRFRRRYRGFSFHWTGCLRQSLWGLSHQSCRKRRYGHFPRLRNVYLIGRTGDHVRWRLCDFTFFPLSLVFCVWSRLRKVLFLRSWCSVQAFRTFQLCYWCPCVGHQWCQSFPLCRD